MRTKRVPAEARICWVPAGIPSPLQEALDRRCERSMLSLSVRRVRASDNPLTRSWRSVMTGSQNRYGTCSGPGSIDQPLCPGEPMFKKTKVCTGLMLAFGGSLALGSLPALAQDTAQRVEIT